MRSERTVGDLKLLLILAAKLQFSALFAHSQSELMGEISRDSAVALFAFLVDVKRVHGVRAPKLAQAVVKYLVASFVAFKSDLKQFADYYDDLKYMSLAGNKERK